MPANPILKLNSVVKRFGQFTALRGVNLEIHEGEFFTIVGPSGSGKSTMIRLLVGMDELTEGEILLRGERIDQTPANLRPTCMVFQSLALFPHMTVGQNIEFPLKLKKVDSSQRKTKAFELLDTLRLPQHCYDKRISQCSGGERQRVALARALAFDPEILFFDEPLSSLDYRLRKTLEKELKDLHHRTGKTFVYITHSLEEAMVMSDRIAIMKAGKFEQISDADGIYSRPVSKFVAKFMGEVNLFDVERSKSDGLVSTGVEIHVNGGSAKFRDQLPEDGRGTIMVRPEDAKFLAPGETADFIVHGMLQGTYILGSRIQHQVQTASGDLVTIENLREDRFLGTEGDEVTIGFDQEAIHLIVENG